MNTYSLKVDTQNLSKSFIYYENDNLNFDEATEKLKIHLEKYNDFISKGIEPVVYDDRNRAIKVTKMYLIKNN
tara:strand:+ start:92 stop:310 length:219 start_codon:yes stop_codon:yes gene_type:complete